MAAGADKTSVEHIEKLLATGPPGTENCLRPSNVRKSGETVHVSWPRFWKDAELSCMVNTVYHVMMVFPDVEKIEVGLHSTDRSRRPANVWIDLTHSVRCDRKEFERMRKTSFKNGPIRIDATKKLESAFKTMNGIQVKKHTD